MMSQEYIRFEPVQELQGLVDIERTVLVADSVTRTLLPPGFESRRVVIVERGEDAKSDESLQGLYGEFLRLGVERDWSIIGFGGGSVCDLAGFAASTWMRGVDFGFVPTTLLAMVDASLGGKNGIDFKGYKNLIGLFNQPRFVLIDPELLSGLPDADLAAGMAEVIKHGIIDGEQHLAAIEWLVSKDGIIERSLLGPVIRQSIELKTSIVSSDERESGDRRKLNLGHTIGHGIETASGLPHGACVAAGLALAFELAVERGGTQEDKARIVELIERLGLPSSIEAARLASKLTQDMSPEQFRQAIVLAMAADKKRVGDELLFVLPMAIGDVRIVPVSMVQLSDFVRRAP
ncbi:3-dehydroquinate synthase [Spirochaetota bacterium]|jgi:3-dehydroquinate synthase